MILTALLIFTIGTIVCSVANNIAILLAGRCVQGIGGGGLVALTYVVVADMVSLRERGKWFSIISLQWAIGSGKKHISHPNLLFSIVGAGRLGAVSRANRKQKLHVGSQNSILALSSH